MNPFRIRPNLMLAGAMLLSPLLTACEPSESASATADPAVPALTARLDALEAESSGLRAELDALEAEVPALRASLATLQAHEDIRRTLLKLSAVIDSGDPSLIRPLIPAFADDFTMVAVDFGEHGEQDTLMFEGLQGLLTGFGPILLEAQPNLMPSAIDVEMSDGETARATFKFANSVRPPSALGEDVHEKVLLFAAITADLRLEDGMWKLVYLELIHSLAYPGEFAPADPPAEGG